MTATATKMSDLDAMEEWTEFVRAVEDGDIIVGVIVGGIGAGKRTLLDIAADAIKEKLAGYVIKVPEPSEEWEKSGILANFYEDRARWAFAFQTEVRRSRWKALRDAVSGWKTKLRYNPEIPMWRRRVVLLERSLLDDSVFWWLQRDLVKPVEKTIYDALTEEYARWTPFMSEARVIVLDTSIAVCSQRIEARNRVGEVGHVPEDYQRDLRAATLRYYYNLLPDIRCPVSVANVTIIDSCLADADFRVPGQVQDTVLSLIFCALDPRRGGGFLGNADATSKALKTVS